jgi:hypothetical protein
MVVGERNWDGEDLFVSLENKEWCFFSDFIKKTINTIK